MSTDHGYDPRYYDDPPVRAAPPPRPKGRVKRVFVLAALAVASYVVYRFFSEMFGDSGPYERWDRLQGLLHPDSISGKFYLLIGGIVVIGLTVLGAITGRVLIGKVFGGDDRVGALLGAFAVLFFAFIFLTGPHLQTGTTHDNRPAEAYTVPVSEYNAAALVIDYDRTFQGHCLTGTCWTQNSCGLNKTTVLTLGANCVIEQLSDPPSVRRQGLVVLKRGWTDFDYYVGNATVTQGEFDPVSGTVTPKKGSKEVWLTIKLPPAEITSVQDVTPRTAQSAKDHPKSGFDRLIKPFVDKYGVPSNDNHVGGPLVIEFAPQVLMNVSDWGHNAIADYYREEADNPSSTIYNGTNLEAATGQLVEQSRDSALETMFGPLRQYLKEKGYELQLNVVTDPTLKPPPKAWKKAHRGKTLHFQLTPIQKEAQQSTPPPPRKPNL